MWTNCGWLAGAGTRNVCYFGTADKYPTDARIYYPLYVTPRGVVDVDCVDAANLQLQCESKNPLEDLWQFFQNSWEFFDKILRAH